MDQIDQKVYAKAIQFLNVRMHTTGELQKKLQTRGFAPDKIQPVLRRLEELKFLDDERFAQIFVDNLKRYKDFGFYGIKSKLLGRIVPNDLAEQALEEFFSEQDELAVAERLLAKLKRIGRVAPEKLQRSLQSRGFRQVVIRKILR